MSHAIEISIGTLAGTAVDFETLDGLGNTYITILDLGMTVKTTDSGNFFFPVLTPGEHDLSIEREGYQTVVYRNIKINTGLITVLQGAGLIPVTANGQAGVPTVKNGSELYAVSGRIIDVNTLEYIENATVRLAGTFQESKSEDNGVFSLPVVSGDSITLDVFASGYFPTTILLLHSTGLGVESQDIYLETNDLTGDVNGDGKVNAVDIQTVVNSALNITTALASDLNEDRNVDAIDVQLITNYALGISDN